MTCTGFAGAAATAGVSSTGTQNTHPSGAGGHQGCGFHSCGGVHCGFDGTSQPGGALNRTVMTRCSARTGSILNEGHPGQTRPVSAASRCSGQSPVIVDGSVTRRIVVDAVSSYWMGVNRMWVSWWLAWAGRAAVTRGCAQLRGRPGIQARQLARATMRRPCCACRMLGHDLPMPRCGSATDLRPGQSTWVRSRYLIANQPIGMRIQ